jgi:hypothetical protein
MDGRATNLLYNFSLPNYSSLISCKHCRKKIVNLVSKLSSLTDLVRLELCLIAKKGCNKFNVMIMSK